MRRAVLACGIGLLSTAGAQTPEPSYRPVLLPGCALPPARLIAAAAPLEVELKLAVDPSGAVLGVDLSKASGVPELDPAFASAARACRFEPFPQAPLQGRKSVEYKLTYRHDGGPLPLGIHGCFATEYPSRARLREEEGTSTITFRVPAGTAEPEVRLSRSSGSGTLDAEALLRASRCLSNAAVRAGLLPDHWYQQSIRWVLL